MSRINVSIVTKQTHIGAYTRLWEETSRLLRAFVHDLKMTKLALVLDQRYMYI